MSATRKRRTTAAGLVIGSLAVLIAAFGGSASGQKSVDVVQSLAFSTVTGSTPAPTQTQDNTEYTVLTASAQCPAGSTAIAGNGFFSIANTEAGTLDGDELLLAGVKKVGSGYSAEGLTDINGVTTPHNFVVEVTCATTATAKVAKPSKGKKKKKKKKTGGK